MQKPCQPVRDTLEDAVQHHRAGRLAEAERIYRQILATQAQGAGSRHSLGAIADAHSNLGSALAAQGRIVEAVAHYERALVLHPRHANALNNLGNIFKAQSKLTAAVACYQQAVAIKPDFAEAHSNLANALQLLGRTADAITHYERALVLNPAHANTHSNLGAALASEGRLPDAIAHLKRALVLNPEQPDAHNNLGNIFKEWGKFDEAMAHYSRAIAARPDFAEAHFNRAEIKSFHAGDPDLKALENLAGRRDLSPDKSLFIHFALAKGLEDSEDYVRAFEHLRKGNTLKRQQIDFDEARVMKRFQRISNVFDKSLFDRFHGAGDPSSVPVFVLGMPRSGSTLIEQILASHPQIHGAGELPGLAIVAGRTPPALDRNSLRQLGEAYLASLPAVASGRIRIIDKSPTNFFNIGLIRLILPNARIIHTVRHPIDTCVSCYSKLFSTGLHFSYDLAELGRYYKRYSELMTHWRTVLPEDAMLDVSYEDVVDDLEGQARRLIEYCGLPWDDRCIAFHKTDREVKTASAVQVRKPLFRSSIQRWLKYQSGLDPLLLELGAV